MLEVSGSVALQTVAFWLSGSGPADRSCTVPAAICLLSGLCVYWLGSGSQVPLVSEVKWYYPCYDVQ